MESNEHEKNIIYVVKAEICGVTGIGIVPFKSLSGAQKKFSELVKEYFTIDELLSARMNCELNSDSGLLQVMEDGIEYSCIEIDQIELND